MGKNLKPKILLEGHYDHKRLKIWKDGLKIWRQKDLLAVQLAEYYEITTPGKSSRPGFARLDKDYTNKEGATSELAGDWIYFPWNGLCIHNIDAQRFHELRTNRNRNIINQDEQQKLANTKVAVAGLSVGLAIASGLAYTGISDSLSLADFDILSTTNLNRVCYGIGDIGENKLDLASKYIYELNPYADIKGFGRLDSDNLDQFFAGAKVVFDEIDDFEMKVRLRLKAKELKIPLLMITSLGDRVLIDVERYDATPQPELFNGLLGVDPNEILSSEIGEPEKIKYAMQTVGVSNIPTRALLSLGEINKTLVGRPQLYSTVAINGGIGPYLVRQLVNRNEPKSGRYKLDLNEAVGLSDPDLETRETIIAELRKFM